MLSGEKRIFSSDRGERGEREKTDRIYPSDQTVRKAESAGTPMWDGWPLLERREQEGTHLVQKLIVRGQTGTCDGELARLVCQGELDLEGHGVLEASEREGGGSGKGDARERVDEKG